MKELLEFLAKSIVNHPEEVEVNEESQEGIVNLKLKVNSEDLKLIIGRQGQTIRAIRNLIRTKAIKEGKRVAIEIEE